MTVQETNTLAAHLPFIRSQFPGLDTPWAYFDNAGGSQVLRGVADQVRDYLLTASVQLGASYETSRKAQGRVDEGTRSVARLINAADVREIVLGSSTTQLMANLAAALAPSFSAGDEIIVTNTDHEANIGAWTRLGERGVVIKVWQVDPDTLELGLEDLDALMTASTRLVCCTHASNVLGSINPVTEIARRVHARGAQIVVDGVAYAPHRQIDVQALGVDYYVFSLYKVFGPHLALLYGRLEHLEKLSSLNHFFLPASDIPYKFQPGNVNYELTASLTGITGYLEALGQRLGARTPGPEALRVAFGAMAEHEARLADLLITFLKRQSKVRIIGRATSSAFERVATISFVIDGQTSASVPARLDPHHLAVRHGHFYAYRLLEALGLEPSDGVVRVSMAHYNTAEEVERLLVQLGHLGLD